MLKTLKGLLLKIVDDIDAGTSELTEDQCVEAIRIISSMSNNNELLNTYQACKFLNMPRSTFNLYREKGLLPKGVDTPGETNKRYYKSDLKEFLRKNKKNLKNKSLERES